MNILAIDTEYTSFYSPDKRKSGELLQLSIVPIIDGIKGEPFNEYCKPLTHVWNNHAEKVHGISKKRAATFQHPEKLAEKLIAYLEEFDCMFTPVGHNCKGDKNYIDRLLSDYGYMNKWSQTVKVKWHDTMEIAKKKKSIICTKNYKLDTLCKFLKIDINAHDALSDANATAELYMQMNEFISASSTNQIKEFSISQKERRKKYIDMKYVTIHSDGDVYITSYGTGNKDALLTILEELYSIYISS